MVAAAVASVPAGSSALLAAPSWTALCASCKSTCARPAPCARSSPTWVRPRQVHRTPMALLRVRKALRPAGLAAAAPPARRSAGPAAPAAAAAACPAARATCRQRGPGRRQGAYHWAYPPVRAGTAELPLAAAWPCPAAFRAAAGPSLGQACREGGRTWAGQACRPYLAHRTLHDVQSAWQSAYNLHIARMSCIQ